MTLCSSAIRVTSFENIDYKKFIVPVGSLVLGWLLAQFTGIFKDWHRVRTIRRCLMEELSELQSELERTLTIYARQLQIYALGGIDNASPSPLSNHVFRSYYKDAVLGMSKEQRISLQLIHTLLENLNRRTEEHRTLTKSLHSKRLLEGSTTDKDIEEWGNLVRADFSNAAALSWHVRFHLAHQRAPILSTLSPTHESFLKYSANVDAEITKIIDGAKTLKREQFEKAYDPEVFVKNVLTGSPDLPPP